MKILELFSGTRPYISRGGRGKFPLKILELFSGTGSIGKVAKFLNWSVISVDIDGKFNPTFKCDILEFDYKQYPIGYFDVIWSSPPCTKYSKASRIPIAQRDLTSSNQIVQHTLDIIEYLKPTYWFLENPQSGYLKAQSFMKELSYTDVDYCMYGYLCRKRTRIWNNVPNLTLKLCKYACPVSKNGIHIYSLSSAKNGRKQVYRNINQRHSIPFTLIYDLFSQLHHCEKRIIKLRTF